MKINQQDILDIIKNVGGKENISLLTHCVTRLRFVLKDESKIDEKNLKENSLVKGCFSVKGQYQVIIGPGLVDQVYDLVLAETGAKEADNSELKDVEDEAMNPLQKALKLFSDVFYPILPAIVGAGLLLGISNLLTNGGIFGKESLVVMFPAIAGLANMITMVANTAFTYIPVLVAWSAAKRFGGSPMLGVLLGLVLINGDLIPGSQMSSVISGAVEPQYWNIFGIDILKIGYQNSVLPALVASWVLVVLEKWLKKHLPNSVQLIFVAPISIFVTAFLTFLCIGPAMNQVAAWITDAIVLAFDKVPILAGFLFGVLWEPLVVTGMHHAFIEYSAGRSYTAKLYAFHHHHYLRCRSRSCSCDVKINEEQKPKRNCDFCRYCSTFGSYRAIDVWCNYSGKISIYLFYFKFRSCRNFDYALQDLCGFSWT